MLLQKPAVKFSKRLHLEYIKEKSIAIMTDGSRSLTSIPKNEEFTFSQFKALPMQRYFIFLVNIYSIFG